MAKSYIFQCQRCGGRYNGNYSWMRNFLCPRGGTVLPIKACCSAIGEIQRQGVHVKEHGRRCGGLLKLVIR